MPSKQAEKYLQKLDKNTKIRIRDGILGIPEGDIKPMEGMKNYYRLVVGGYRVIFRWLSEHQIFLFRIGPRGDIYKGV